MTALPASIPPANQNVDWRLVRAVETDDLVTSLYKVNP